MHKWLRILMKIIPFLAGVAYVSTNLEKKTAHKFSFKRALLLLMAALISITLWLGIYVWSHMDDSFTGTSNGCAVVFGAAVWKADIPSHALNDRIQEGIALYKNNRVSCLVFSGGASKFGAHEVAVMTQIATRAGVPLSAIVQDFEGNNTLQTIINLKPQSGYVLVSNDFHLGRIKLIARRLGLKNYAVHAAPYLNGRYGENAYYFAREMFGTALLWLKL